MFSVELSVWFYCVQENGFLGVSENSRKNHGKSTHPTDQCARSGARGQPGGPRRPAGAFPLPAAPGGRLGGSSPLWCPTLTPIYSRGEKTPEQKSFSQFLSRSRRHPLFFSGRANLEVVLSFGEGRSSPSSSPSPLHHPSMTSPFMCE